LPDPAPLLGYTERLITVAGGAATAVTVDGRHVIVNADQDYTVTVNSMAGQTAAQMAVADVYCAEAATPWVGTFVGGSGVTVIDDGDVTMGTGTGTHTRYQLLRAGTSGNISRRLVETGVTL
jgi:hypothetical protein